MLIATSYMKFWRRPTWPKRFQSMLWWKLNRIWCEALDEKTIHVPHWHILSKLVCFSQKEGILGVQLIDYCHNLYLNDTTMLRGSWRSKFFHCINNKNQMIKERANSDSQESCFCCCERSKVEEEDGGEWKLTLTDFWKSSEDMFQFYFNAL